MHVEGKILVYDLGGGTFDVSILEMMEGALDVLSSRGINQLGGKDFDEAIVNEIIQSFEKEYGIDVSGDLDALTKIKDEAEKAKITLSSTESDTIYFSYLAIQDGRPIPYDFDITRKRYEQLIEEKINQTIATVREALEAAHLTINDIDIVLAVGGSSRTPLVIRKLRELFGDKIRGGVNPDEAVALGAAVQAGLISNEISGRNSIAIFDICNHTLGTSVLNDDNTELEYSRLIMRDTHLPFAMKRRYQTAHDFQRAVEVEIYQGESDDLSENIKLGTLEVDGIPENYRGREQVDIEFKYNINGMLEVYVTIVSTGKMQSKKINMLSYDAPKTSVDIAIDNLEWEKYSLADDVKATVMLYQNRRDSLPDDIKSKADMIMRQLYEAVMKNDTEHAEELDNTLTDLLFEF